MDYLPRIISWNVTAACNLRCPHCYLDAGRRRADELSTAEALGLVDQMADAGAELLILTGGEPLIRKDLPVLAQRAAARGMVVVLGTTGTLLDRERARALKESGVTAAGISVDSTDPGKHDAFRGVAGAWARAVAGIEACRAEGLDVLVHTTALKMNVREIPDLVRFAHQQGARAFHLFFLVCTGRGEQLTDLSPEEYETLLAFVLDSQAGYPGMMVRARCAPYVQRLAQERGADALPSAGCLAGTSYCRITPKGDVTPCPYLPLQAGNVRGEPFQTLWASSPVLQQFRTPRLEGKCGACHFAQGAEPLCVGCRARSFALTGDLLGADPWCRYEPQPVAPPAEQPAITWTPEALDRLGRIPGFIRGRVKQGVEAYARRQGLTLVTPEVLAEVRARAMGGPHPPLWGRFLARVGMMIGDRRS
ncbi:MAG: radical SAM protein, partial [Chloroflexi bacterium]|nr:radical SAM protein [Chloroflexota bacterium]